MDRYIRVSLVPTIPEPEAQRSVGRVLKGCDTPSAFFLSAICGRASVVERVSGLIVGTPTPPRRYLSPNLRACLPSCIRT